MIVERFICHVCGHVGTCARADAASAAAATRREKGAMAEGRTLSPTRIGSLALLLGHRTRAVVLQELSLSVAQSGTVSRL